MNTDTTYNGWTNYATWNINLWAANTEGDYRNLRAIAQSIREDYELSDTQKTEAMAEAFRDYWQGGTPDLPPNRLSEVNWEEIAYHLIEED